jgi:cation diffusion facilitator family transporter
VTTPASTRAVYAALVSNLLVAASKAVAAAWTGSSAMLSEAVHSFVDTGNEVLLLYGMRRAVRRSDPEHPLGHGRELYFWSFVVALLVFALGAGVAVYEGIVHAMDPEPISDPLVNYVVLALAFLFEGSSWWISLQQFRTVKGDLSYGEAFRRSKDPPSFMVLFEDTAALLGIAIAAVGTWLSVRLHAPIIDGVASMLIGLVLGAVALLLARESKSLLIGERADRLLTNSILRIAGAEQSIARANGLLTVQLAPDQVLALLSLEFADDLRTPEIEDRVVEIERKIRAAHPEVAMLFVKPQTDRTFRDAIRRRFGDGPFE